MRIEKAEKNIFTLDKKMNGIASMLADIMDLVKRLVSESEENKKKEVEPIMLGSSSHADTARKKTKENMTSENSEVRSMAAFRREGSERLKFKRFEMPIFYGEKSDVWVYKAETYFEIH